MDQMEADESDPVSLGELDTLLSVLAHLLISE